MISTVLKVERSVMDARWVFPAVSNDDVQRMMVDFAVPEIVARLLAARQVPPEKVDSFLFPRLSRDFPDPMAMRDMQGFANWLADAIEKKKKIAAFCDFDVDGSTSAAVLKKFFRHLLCSI